MAPVQIRKSFLQKTICLIASAILIWSSGAPVAAADITVNASCTLADAITAANTDTATGGCPAGSGADTIILSSAVEVSDGPIRISSELTINGGFHSISGPPNKRMFEVGETGNLHFHRVKLKKTSSENSFSGEGGLVYNEGTLRVTKSTFENSHAGGGGGGIYNALAGVLTIDSSFFRNLRAGSGRGGALLNAGRSTITNSTFTQNSALQGGAAASIIDYDNRNIRSLDIKNVTFINNRTTYTGESLADSFGSISLANSIMYSTTSLGHCRIIHHRNMSHNYASPGRNCSGSIGGDLKLGALFEPADGSPPYFPLEDGSVALGMGHPDHCPATDMLGNARPLPADGQANCDLGAIESAFAFPTPTTTPTLTPTHTATGTLTPAAVTPTHTTVPTTNIVVDANCNLRDAILSANTDTSVGGCTAGSLQRDVIVLSQDTNVSYTLPSFSSSLRLEGGLNLITVERNIRLFEVAANGNVEIDDLRITRADGLSRLGNAGSFIYARNGGVLKVSGSTFTNGWATNGGAIFSEGTITISGSYFGGNRASNTGGALRITNSSGTVVNSTFSENSARIGGGIGNGYSATLTLTNVTMFANSSVDGWANALWNDLYLRASAYMSNSIIAGSSSGADCGHPAAMQTTNSYVEGASCLTTFNESNAGAVNLGALVTPADGSPPFYPLLSNSPALGAGNSAHCPATDQRGNARPNPAGGNCDLGAVESSLLPPTATASPTASATSAVQDSPPDPTDTATPTATATATRDPAGVPSNLRATVSLNRVTLNWDAPSVLPDGYQVLRRLQRQETYEELRPVFAVEVDDPTTYVDETLSEAGTYEYAVKSIFTTGIAYPPTEPLTVTVLASDLATLTPSPTSSPAASETVTLTPVEANTPKNLNLQVKSNAIVLDWDAPEIEPNAYVVMRRAPDDKAFRELATIPVAGRNDPTSYSDTTVDRAGTYRYAVKSMLGNGEYSPMSRSVDVPMRETDTATPADTSTSTPTSTDTATPTNTFTSTATPSSTATLTSTSTPTPTDTETPTSTPTPTATATATETATATNTAPALPREGCVNVGPGTYWLFPLGNFLNGQISVYASDQCDAANSTTQEIGADGYVHTVGGLPMASVICNAAHTDAAYTAQQQAFNTDIWACQEVKPTATDTAMPPSATDTAVPPTATNTVIPPTLENERAIGNVRAASTTAGELSVSWDAPRETVRDYRIRWAKVGENFRTWSDLNFNAYPTTASYTIVGLEAGERYQVHVRARFAQGSGPWAQALEADVMASVPPTNTATITATAAPTNTATNTPTDTTIPPAETDVLPQDTEVPPTNTATSTATSTPTNTATNTPTNTAVPPTNTAVPPTNTAIPPTNTAAPSVGPREIASVWLNGDPGGAFDVRWSAPSDTPVDYRISWAQDGEDYLSWRDLNGNGYPVANAFTITGLDVNACYMVRVRARYDGSAGGWTEVQGRISGAC